MDTNINDFMQSVLEYAELSGKLRKPLTKGINTFVKTISGKKAKEAWKDKEQFTEIIQTIDELGTALDTLVRVDSRLAEIEIKRVELLINAEVANSEMESNRNAEAQEIMANSSPASREEFQQELTEQSNNNINTVVENLESVSNPNTNNLVTGRINSNELQNDLNNIQTGLETNPMDLEGDSLNQYKEQQAKNQNSGLSGLQNITRALK